MKITELEAYHDEWVESDLTIRAMVGRSEYPQVFSICTASFSCIVPAIQFRKKRDISPEIPDLSAFTTICNCAPPLFEHAAIESLSEFVNSARVLLRSENRFLDSIEVARKREQLAHRLWNHIERKPGMLRQDICAELDVSQNDLSEVVEFWEELGIVCRQPADQEQRLFLRTRLDAEVGGCCPNCGVHGKGRREAFYRSTACRKCGVEGHYHIEYDDSGIR